MKNNYHEKKQARLERYQALAVSNESKSDDAYNSSKAISDFIPFGQPILIGHHSEKRHRRDIDKINNKMGQCIELSKKAKYYEGKAESLLNDNTISSDNPDALELLQEKLQHLQKAQELYKQINKVIKKKISDSAKIDCLIEIGVKEETAAKLLTPDFCGRIGIPSFKLTNNNGRMKQVKDRIHQLQKIAAVPEYSETKNEITISIDKELNRIKAEFLGKPSDEIRTHLKRNGFRWSPTVTAWIGNINLYRLREVKKIWEL